MRSIPPPLFLVCIMAITHASAQASAKESPLERRARALVNESCGSCHDGARSSANPAALKIFDLRESNWTARMSDQQLRIVAARTRTNKKFPSNQQAVVERFVETKLLERAASALAYFVGDWRCQGTHFQTEFGPASTGSAGVEIKPIMHGAWYSVRVETPGGYEGAGFWGLEAGAKKLAMVFVNSAGEMESKTSPGPNGNEFTWTGETQFDDRKVKEREVFAKRPPDEFSRAVEMLAGNGEWTKVSEEICRR